MKLNEDNYFSSQADKEYCSNSQLKSFMQCEARALAEINGTYKRETTDSMLLGSYVDCQLLTPEKLSDFISNNPQLYSSKGKLYAKFELAEKMVESVKRQPTVMNALKGDHQAILTADIFGVPFKAKLDVLGKNYITDLKTTASFTKKEYDASVGKYVGFAEYHKYDLQGAIYQEIVYKVTGKRLPFFIAAVTSEKHPRVRLMLVDQDSLDKALEEAHDIIVGIPDLKAGKVKPMRCNECDFCADTEIITDYVDWLGRELTDE